MRKLIRKSKRLQQQQSFGTRSKRKHSTGSLLATSATASGIAAPKPMHQLGYTSVRERKKSVKSLHLAVDGIMMSNTETENSSASHLSHHHHPQQNHWRNHSHDLRLYFNEEQEDYCTQMTSTDHHDSLSSSLLSSPQRRIGQCYLNYTDMTLMKDVTFATSADAAIATTRRKSSRVSAGQPASSSSSSASYYFMITIFIILILCLHISPSHEQYFSGSGHIQHRPLASGSHLSSSLSASDEWDTFSSSLISSSSSSSSSGSSSSSSAIASASTYGHGYNCVNIPVNFTLCKNIGYSKMMVPNLLGHDSLQEAEYHAKAWVPLLGLQCHPDTQLFLCSLFTPICLDRPIYPCRSLCQVVQAKCEPRMLTYKYPWPSMLKCDQFPEDHDLCIRPGAANAEEKIDEPECPSCHQAHTCENIVDNYCRSNFVFRAKFKRAQGSTVEFRKGRWFKPPQESRRGRPDFRSFDLDPKDNCCNSQLTPGVPYIVMGVMRGDQRVVTFVMQWNGKDKILKNAVRTFRSMDCSNPLPMSVMAVGEEESSTSRGNNNKTISSVMSISGTGNGNGHGRRRQRRRKDGQGQNGGGGNHRKGRQYGGCRVTMASDRNQ